MVDPTVRFSSRVEMYKRYRPGYPPAVVELMKQKCGLSPDAMIADVGSGTGVFSSLLLANGNRVFGVEPNSGMRRVAERRFENCARFVSVAATAESTRLAEHSVDFITAAQSFHWFDRQRTRLEFARILKTGGWVVLVWNRTRTSSTPFLAAYHSLLQTYGTNYDIVRQGHGDQSMLESFFSPHGVEVTVFDNRQLFDFDGLKGRLLSSSYTPEPGDARLKDMLYELGRIFRTHQVNGKVNFEYDTLVCYGRLP